MTTVLITGSNKGLGAESARRLAALGWTVWMGARDVAAAETTAAAIRAEPVSYTHLTLPTNREV